MQHLQWHNSYLLLIFSSLALVHSIYFTHSSTAFLSRIRFSLKWNFQFLFHFFIRMERVIFTLFWQMITVALVVFLQFFSSLPEILSRSRPLHCSLLVFVAGFMSLKIPPVALSISKFWRQIIYFCNTFHGFCALLINMLGLLFTHHNVPNYDRIIIMHYQ